MLEAISRIVSKIKAALLQSAVRHPTHFPAVPTAMTAKDGEPAPDGDAAKTKDDSAP